MSLDGQTFARGCDLNNFLTPVVKALGGGEAIDRIASRSDRQRLGQLIAGTRRATIAPYARV